MNIEQKSINTLRMLSIDQIQEANSGHPGLPLGAAPMAYALWKKMKKNPQDPKWINRDRFILSAGHGSALLYSLLHLFGYGLTMEDLKNFRKFGSLTPGHPEYGHTVGVEATTGPLGQGISMAVGMAMAEEHLAALYNKDYDIIDHYTYVICGDGDLMEGISNEASSLAGTLGLKKLIVLYDSNSITIEGSTDLAFREDVCARYEALGWNTLEVEDGNDIEDISKAIDQAKESTDKPTLIKITTQIGYGSPRAGKAKAHGEPLGDDMAKTREFYGFGEETFTVDEEVYAHFKDLNKDATFQYEMDKRVEKLYAEKYPAEYKKLVDSFENKFDVDIFDEDYYKSEKDMATRASSGEVLNRISEKFDLFFGGSADLAPSNKSNMKNKSNFSAEDREGSNINFGIREHAMGAVINGILLHGGLKAYGATFLIFSDYLKPALRLSALQKLPAIHILTHDSVGVGEDGPTHQPIEQLAMLRSIPDNVVFRPADFLETAVAWEVAFKSKDRPVCLALSRQTLPNLANSSKDAAKGAYVIKRETTELKKIVIATGSEVSKALEATENMEEVRVVSMPSMELFEEQSEAYKEEVLPASCEKRLVVEAASSFGWHKYAGLKGKIMSIDEFGASGKGSDVFEHFGINADNIKKIISEM